MVNSGQSVTLFQGHLQQAKVISLLPKYCSQKLPCLQHEDRELAVHDASARNLQEWKAAVSWCHSDHRPTELAKTWRDLKKKLIVSLSQKCYLCRSTQQWHAGTAWPIPTAHEPSQALRSTTTEPSSSTASRKTPWQQQEIVVWDESVACHRVDCSSIPIHRLCFCANLVNLLVVYPTAVQVCGM